METKNYIGEIWVSVRGYIGLYQVSNFGRVMSLNYDKTGKIKLLKLVLNAQGYYQVCLHKNGVQKIKKVHRLVAEAFIPNPKHLPSINHKDEDKTNNRLSNLEWCTVKYNTNYGTCQERKKEKISGEKHYLYGKHRTQEFKDIVSNKLKGRESPNNGKTASEETRMKMSLAHRKNKQ